MMLTRYTFKEISALRMNGWHRLWILASFLAFISCALYINASWPEEQSIPHSIAFYDALDLNARAQITETESGSNAGIRMPNGHVIYLKPDVAASRKTEALLQYQEAVAVELRVKQRHLLLTVSIVWFSSCFALLVFGHLIGWVIRGFRDMPNKSSN